MLNLVIAMLVATVPTTVMFAAEPTDPAQPVWQNLGPGGGGWIQSICASPHNGDELFVGCDVGGFYHSADGGGSYRIWNMGLEDYFVECIVPHPHDLQVIYLGCQSGVYKSTDRGQTWRLLRDGFPPKSTSNWTAPIGALAIDPKRPEVLYAGIGRPRAMTFGKGALYKSLDGGEHWRRVNSPGSLPEDAWISDLVLDPRDSSHLYLACQHGLYQSSNAGETWRRATDGMSHHHVRRVAICTGQPDVMYATLWTEPGRATWQGGVYKSVDGGERWQPCLEGLAQHVSKPGEASQRTFNYDRLAVHPRNPDVAYVGGDGWGNSKIYKTADGGRSWNVTNIVDRGWIDFNGPSVKCLTMSPLDPDVLYFGTSMHVFKTTDAGATWRQAYCRTFPDGRFVGSGLEVLCSLSVTVHPADSNRLYFGYADVGAIVSEDGGASFHRGVTGLDRGLHQGSLAMAFDPLDPQHCWAGFGWRSVYGWDSVIAESRDGGYSWQKVGTPESGLPSGLHDAIVLDARGEPGNRKLVAITRGHGVYRSLDSGRTWQAANSGLESPGLIAGLAAHPSDDDVYWCVTRGATATVYRSDDGAQTWRRVSRDLRAADVRNFAVAPADPRRLYLTARHYYERSRGVFAGGVYRSDDGGVTWQHVLEDRFAEGLAVDPRDADVVYAGLTDHPYHDESTGRGILGSRDGGRTWTSLNGNGLTCRHVTTITIDPNQPTRLYLGTGGNGVFVGEVPP